MRYVNNQYEPKPVKRVIIPKGTNDTRPFGIPTIDDRILQQAMNQLLTPYYEKQFSEWSFGFRPHKSCHDAIKRWKHRFTGVNYLIKIDIKGYFDSIDHEILMNLIRRGIKKNKALTTIERWLKVGMIERGEYNKTFSGSPQGGILSPLLANIYLHQIDEKMDKLIKEGRPERDNPGI